MSVSLVLDLVRHALFVALLVAGLAGNPFMSNSPTMKQGRVSHSGYRALTIRFQMSVSQPPIPNETTKPQPYSGIEFTRRKKQIAVCEPFAGFFILWRSTRLKYFSRAPLC